MNYFQESPLTNVELSSYVAEQARQPHYQERHADFIGHDKAPLHHLAYNAVSALIDDAESPAVRVEANGEHALSADLHEGIQKVSMNLTDHVYEIEWAIKHPRHVQQMLADAHKKFPQAFAEPAKYKSQPEVLNLKEVKAFINVMQNEALERKDDSQEVLSWGVMAGMVDHWQDQQNRLRGANPLDTQIKLNPGKVAGNLPKEVAKPLETHVRKSANEFTPIAEEKIRHLGQAVLDAAGVRRQLSDREVGHSQGQPIFTAERTTRSEKLSDHERSALNEAVKASEGQVLIHTDLPSGVQVKDGSRMKTSAYGGFQNFGDSGIGNNEWTRYLVNEAGGGYGMQIEGSVPPDMVEVASFQPVTNTKYENVEVEERKWGRRTTRTERKYAGEERQTVRNPITGQTEAAVHFDYAYNPRLRGGLSEKELGLPEYREVSGMRSGNLLLVRTTLPESVAVKLEGLIRSKPQVAREFVHDLVIANGVTEALWQGNATTTNNPIRPPYTTRLPLYIAKPADDGKWSVRPIAF